VGRLESGTTGKEGLTGREGGMDLGGGERGGGGGEEGRQVLASVDYRKVRNARALASFIYSCALPGNASDREPIDC
jgi:hypothetical protein